MPFSVKTLDVLLHVQDPGAANFVAPLPAALERRSITSKLIATGLAMDYFSRRGIVHQEVDHASASRLLDELSPQLVLVGTSENRESVDLALIAECRAKHITCAAAIDMNVNERLRFAGTSADPLRFMPDWLLVTDEATQKKYAALGIDKSRIAIVGHPHFDYVVETRAHFESSPTASLRAKYGLPLNRQVILFAAEPHSAINPESTSKNSRFTMNGFSGNSQSSVIALEELITAISKLEKKPFLAVKLHPKNRPEEFEHLVQIDQVIGQADPLEVAWCADVVAGVGSMLLEESHLLGIPTVSISPSVTACQHWLACIASGEVDCVNDPNLLPQALSELLSRDRRTTIAEPAIPRVVEFIRGQLQTVSP